LKIFVEQIVPSRTRGARSATYFVNVFGNGDAAAGSLFDGGVGLVVEARVVAA
jgi:hypothetical protein